MAYTVHQRRHVSTYARSDHGVQQDTRVRSPVSHRRTSTRTVQRVSTGVQVIYLYYTLLALGSLPVTLLALVLAPVLPLFATRQSGVIDNGASVGLGMRLPTWLNLMDMHRMYQKLYQALRSLKNTVKLYR